MQNRLVKAKEKEDEHINTVVGCTLDVAIEKLNSVLTVATLNGTICAPPLYRRSHDHKKIRKNQDPVFS